MDTETKLEVLNTLIAADEAILEAQEGRDEAMQKLADRSEEIAAQERLVTALEGRKGRVLQSRDAAAQTVAEQREEFEGKTPEFPTIKICVNTFGFHASPFGKDLDIEVQLTDTVGVIKRKVEELGFDTKRGLCFNDRMLDDDAIVEECGIKEGDEIMMPISTVEVKSSKGPVTIPTEPAEFVEELKAKLDDPGVCSDARVLATGDIVGSETQMLDLKDDDLCYVDELDGGGYKDPEMRKMDKKVRHLERLIRNGGNILHQDQQRPLEETEIASGTVSANGKQRLLTADERKDHRLLISDLFDKQTLDTKKQELQQEKQAFDDRKEALQDERHGEVLKAITDDGGATRQLVEACFKGDQKPEGVSTKAWAAELQRRQTVGAENLKKAREEVRAEQQEQKERAQRKKQGIPKSGEEKTEALAKVQIGWLEGEIETLHKALDDSKETDPMKFAETRVHLIGKQIELENLRGGNTETLTEEHNAALLALEEEQAKIDQDLLKKQQETEEKKQQMEEHMKAIQERKAEQQRKQAELEEEQRELEAEEQSLNQQNGDLEPPAKKAKTGKEKKQKKEKKGKKDKKEKTDNNEVAVGLRKRKPKGTVALEVDGKEKPEDKPAEEKPEEKPAAQKPDAESSSEDDAMPAALGAAVGKWRSAP